MTTAASGPAAVESRPRTLLICHAGTPLHEDGLARWLAADSELCGIVRISEDGGTVRRRMKRQLQRDGVLRFMDVLAFRLHYRLFVRSGDAEFERRLLDRLRARYPAIPSGVPVITVRTPNGPEAERFIRACAPGVTFALCKHILKKAVFTIPTHGTFVMHPGICPEYRNAHGCFWALAQGDVGNVGMTLLRIDEGIDTGPVYGYFRCDFDEVQESHLRIQHRSTFENLDAVMATIRDVVAGRAASLDTRGRPSAVWGQPWLTRYLSWKAAARRRAGARGSVTVS